MSEWIWYSVICIAGIGACSTVVMVHAMSLEGDDKKLKYDKNTLQEKLAAEKTMNDIESGGGILQRKSRKNGLNF